MCKNYVNVCSNTVLLLIGFYHTCHVIVLFSIVLAILFQSKDGIELSSI